MTHLDLINGLISRYGYSKYLEVGVRNPDKNINKVYLPEESKVGVDPEVWGNNAKATPEEMKIFIGLKDYDCIFHQTYSEYFWEYNTDKFDLIFIDGLHHASAVLWDIINALRFIRDGGCILVHDVNPATKEMQEIPRGTKEWTGNAWKAWCMAVNILNDNFYNQVYNIDEEINHIYETRVIEEDYGIGIIQVFSSSLDMIPLYDDFDKNRKSKWDSVVYPTIRDFLES